ncbi:MAG: hypothetical protein ACP5OA_02980 [Candidatus Woesearchaeota archaeon]
MNTKQLDERADEMTEFILPMIESNNKEHQTLTIDKKKIHFINSDAGVLWLINGIYTEKEYKQALNIFKRDVPGKFNTVFYKDGQTYFRSAMLSFDDESDIITDWYNKNSLRKYDPEHKRRMILPTKPEIERINNIGKVTYYQPKSQRLEQKLLTYTFWDVIYDYNTTDPDALEDSKRRFFKNEEIAKDCSIWIEKKEHNGILIPSFYNLGSTHDDVHNYRLQTPRNTHLSQHNKYR